MSYGPELSWTQFKEELRLVTISLGAQGFVSVILFGAIREPVLAALAFLGVNFITATMLWIGRRE